MITLAVCGVAGAARTPQQIAVEIQAVGQQLAPLFASPQDLFDPKKRDAAAPTAVPALRRMVALLDELIATRPTGTPPGQEKTQLMGLQAALGDKDVVEKLRTMASSPVAGEAAAGRAAQIFAAWLCSDGKALAQQKVVDDLAALATKYPNESAVAGAALMLAGTTKPEAKELRGRVVAIVTGTLKGQAAATAVRQLELMEKRSDAQLKLKALDGKPLTVEGASAAGGTFSTAAWKGKVVLVDFWATWCEPCKEELPKLKKMYAQYHGQGFEIVGVSCDNEAELLAKFLGENKDMPWPQLFDANEPGWHVLATQFGIDAIPTMLLIDRKGIVRSTDARAVYQKMVPELLKEQP
jgi:thiol-disulfide isomerase/thioredoxin